MPLSTSSSSNLVNALQFVAKLHGSWIALSFTTIILHHIRYRLVMDSRPTLALGLLASPFQTGSPMYLLSKEFRSAARDSLKRPRDIFTALFVAYTSIMIAVSDPSSAIAIIPKLDVWPYPGAIHDLVDSPGAVSFDKVYIGGAYETIYPSRVDSAFDSDCLAGSPGQVGWGLASWADLQCPTITSLNGILEEFPKVAGSSGPLSFPFNVTIGTRTILVNGDPPAFSGGGYTMYATTTLDTVNNLLVSLNDYLSSFYGTPGGYVPDTYGLDPTNLGWNSLANGFSLRTDVSARDSSGRHSLQQPFTGSSCAVAPSNSTSWTFSDIDADEVIVMRMGPSSLPSDFAAHNMSFAFVDVSTVDFEPHTDVSAIFAWENNVAGQPPPLDVLEPPKNQTTVCLVTSRWIDSDPFASYPAQSGVAPSFSASLPAAGGGISRSDAISLDVSWLNNLTGWSDSEDYTTIFSANSSTTYFTDMVQICSRSFQSDPSCIAMGLALGMSNVMSLIPNQFGIYSYGVLDSASSLYKDNSETPISIDPDVLNANFTRLQLDVTKHVYGYGFRGATVYLAFAVLLLHVVTVLAHLLLMLFGRRWSSRAWSSLGELLVLALASQPPAKALENCGAGVDTARVWRSRVSVRAGSENVIGIQVDGGNEEEEVVDGDVGLLGENTGLPLVADCRYR